MLEYLLFVKDLDELAAPITRKFKNPRFFPVSSKLWRKFPFTCQKSQNTHIFKPTQSIDNTFDWVLIEFVVVRDQLTN